MNNRFARWTTPALAFLTLIAAACWWDPPPRDGPPHTPTAIVLTNTPAPRTPPSLRQPQPPSRHTPDPMGLAIEDVKAAVTEAIEQLTSEQVQAITEEASALMCEVAGEVYAPTLTLEDFTEDRRALRDIKSFCASR